MAENRIRSGEANPVTSNDVWLRRRRILGGLSALAATATLGLGIMADGSTTKSAGDAGNKAGDNLGKCMDGGSCGMPASGAVVPLITLNCVENAPKSEMWAMVTPVKPPKNKDWAFEVNVLGPKATDHNKLWAEVDYKNSTNADHTSYGYGKGPMPVTSRPAPLQAALNHSVTFDDTIVRVFTPVIPAQGSEGTVDFSCPGVGTEPPVKFSKFEVTFPQIVG